MACEEVGVKVRQHDVPDVETVLGSEGKVVIDITLRVDDDCRVRALVAHQIRRVRKATKVELLQDHEPPSVNV